MPANENNPKGYFESLRVYQFNDEVLRVVKSSWRDWREINPSWFASAQGQAYLHKARDVLIHEFGELPLGVLKDPRICRMVPFWAEAARMAGFQFLPILAHRNPLEVAKSLNTRDGIDASEGMLVWLRHVLDSEAGTRGMPRCTTSYTAVLHNWVQQVATIQDGLGVVFPDFDDRSSMEIEAFLSRGLRHFDEVPEKVIENPAFSAWVREAYEILERWVYQKETKGDHKQLDRIRAEFNAAAPAFGQLVGGPEDNRFSLYTRLETVQQEVAAAEAREVELTQRINVARQQREALQEELADARRKVSELDGRLGEAEERNAELSEHVERDGRRLTALQNERDGLTGRLRSIEDELGDVRAELARKNTQIEEIEQSWHQSRNDVSQMQSALAQRGLEAEQAAEQAKVAEEKRIAETDRAERLEYDLGRLRAEKSVLEVALEDTQAQHRAALAAETDRGQKRNDVLSVELAELRDSSAQDRALIAELRARVSMVSTDRASFQAASRKREAQLSEALASREAHLQEVRRLSKDLEALRNSTSWRLTGPVRGLLNRLRGAR
ncbi:hypothetical protein [Salipiger sp. PrR002]|uniref:hypothetical protein n=1 Tax=Salipiger sp. PrR002 TaxID=2706489 RepID=UPI0013B6A7A3|nr:hypothetical protein [Salipiger sp. PrR002]NDW01315.1 hypothetical protein [Salipiger sp. PrR002]NDW58896.1 hypothetical protein [Salipiger sp. PrR004]